MPSSIFTGTVETEVLRIAYERRGPAEAPVVLLLHGFPDDVRTWDGVVEPLLAAGYQTLAPSMRGCGGSVFLDARTPRSASQWPRPRMPSTCSTGWASTK